MLVAGFRVFTTLPVGQFGGAGRGFVTQENQDTEDEFLTGRSPYAATGISRSDL